MTKRKTLSVPKSYIEVLEQLKNDIQQTQLKAVLSVTKELTMLYWRIGKELLKRFSKERWGARILERLARDLVVEFPDIKGFSLRNLQYMRKFAESYPNENYAAAAAQIPWGHNMILLDKIPDDLAKRIWYVEQAIENGWSRSILEMWMESNLYGRKGKAITNFKQTLPSPQSDIAEQTIKDPYNFGFLALESVVDLSFCRF